MSVVIFNHTKQYRRNKAMNLPLKSRTIFLLWFIIVNDMYKEFVYCLSHDSQLHIDRNVSTVLEVFIRR